MNIKYLVSNIQYPLYFDILYILCMVFPVGSEVKNPPAKQKNRSLGREDPLEKKISTHSSIFAWEIPGMKEPDGLQSMGSQRVRHDLVTKQQQHIFEYIELNKMYYLH